jgi:hypothetical protein
MVYRRYSGKMATMRQGTVGRMKTVPVKYNGVHLGDLKVVERSDWKNRGREPAPLDFELAKVALSAQAIYEIAERHPRRPDGKDDDEPWLLTICRAVCDAAEEGHSRDLEEDVFRQYIDRYGMDQIISMFGGDPRRMRDRLEELRKSDGA